MEQEDGEGEKIQGSECFRQAFIITRQAAKTRQPAEGRSMTQRRGNRIKPCLAAGSLTTSN